MAKTRDTRLQQTRWSSGTDPVRRTDFDTDADFLEKLVAIYGQGKLVIGDPAAGNRPAPGVKGRFYMTTDTGINGGRLLYDNGSTWMSQRYLSDAYIESTASTNNALLVKGFSGQSADIFAVQNSAGTNLLRVMPNGVITNQATQGITPGVSIASDATQPAIVSVIGNDPAKPLMQLTGASGQTLLSARLNNSAVFTVTADGNITATGSITAKSFLGGASGSSTAIMDVTGSLTTKNLLASPATSNAPAATFRGFTSGTASNIINVQTGGGVGVARVSTDGTVATNGRVVVGANHGGVNNANPMPTGNELASSVNYGGTMPTLSVDAVVGTAPVARFVGHPSQSVNVFEVTKSDASWALSVSNSGVLTSPGLVQAKSLGIGGQTSGSTFQHTGINLWANGTVPIFEVNTTSPIGAKSIASDYNEFAVFRHSVNDASAVGRRVGIALKLSNEINEAESVKYAGIAAYSDKANAATPSLQLYAAGALSAELYGTGRMRLQSVELSPNNSIYTQSSGTMAARGSNFVWLPSATAETSTADLTTAPLMSLATTGTSSRLSVDRLAIKSNNPFNSTAPSFTIGDVNDVHMQFSGQTISVFSNAANTAFTSLNLQPGAANLNLGNEDTFVKIASRTLYVGPNRVYFGGGAWAAVGGAPIENDWWFDHTNNSIKVRNSTTWVTLIDV